METAPGDRPDSVFGGFLCLVLVQIRNLTDDPELRYTQSGLAVANFTLAVSRRERHNGEGQDVTDGFFRCTAWRQTADNAAKSVHKGDRVMVVGRLTQRTFEVEGQKRTTVEVQVQHVGPDLQFQSAEVSRTPAEEKQSA